jgi:flagellar hook assembly protein FlgD
LFQNYPNPFNAETWLPYQLSDDSHALIRIYDVKGQILSILDLGPKKAGYYLSKSQAAYWDGKDAKGQAVSSGIYFYQLKIGDYSATRKMVIVK